MTLINPIDDPFDYMTVGNIGGKPVRSPGFIEFHGLADTRKWDIRLLYGATGAFSVFLRGELAEFSTTFQLPRGSDFTQWNRFKDVIGQMPARVPQGKQPSGYFDVFHPFLAHFGVKALGVKKIGAPERNGDTGGWQITVDWIEWKGAPRISLAKPKAAEAAPKDAIDRFTDELVAQVDALSKPPVKK